VKEEGWYVDPYRLHDARWFSDGTPTALVRDKGATSHDPPPNTPYMIQPVAISDPGSSADDNSDESRDSNDGLDKIWTIFTESPPD